MAPAGTVLLGMFCYWLCSDRPSGAAATSFRTRALLRPSRLLGVLPRVAPLLVLLLGLLPAPAHGKPARAPWQDFLRTASLSGHTSLVRSVAFAPDGKTLVTGGADRALRLWDATTGKPKGTELMPKSG